MTKVRKVAYIFTIIFLFSCSAKQNCIPQISRYDKIIVNVSTENMITAEAAPANVAESSVREIISEYALSELHTRFSDLIEKKLLTISINQPCTDRAILLEGRIFIFQENQSLLLPQRRKSEGKMRLHLTRCSDGTIIKRDDISAINVDSLDTLKELGEEFAKTAAKKLKSCN